MAADVKQLPQPNPPPRKTPRVHPEVALRAAAQGKPRSPFTAPSFPPMVERAVEAAGHKTLAMDEAVASTFAWATNDSLYAAFAEGVVFLGYSYLATLAQRAEYRVVTETISSEMTREWIELKIASGDESKADKKKQIEDMLDNLNVQHCFRKVAESDGFYGRGHLYLDTGRTNDPDELLTDLGNGRDTLSKLKIGPNKGQKLIRLQPIEASWAYPTHYESIDPLARDWYSPVTWYVMSREIHRSRLLTFIGREVPDILKPAYAFGGLSMSQMLKPYVDNWLRTRQAVSDLIQNFSHMVLHTNLDATTTIGGDELFARVALFNNIKTNLGTIVIDKEAEDWSNVSVPLGGLDHLQAQCLPGETLVATERGEIPICDVTTADKVLTRNGWAPLAWAGVSGYVSELVELTTGDGTVLRATSWHPIFCPETNEFVNAGNVRVGDRLLVDPTKPTNTARPWPGAVAGGASQKPVTTAMSRAADFCTESFTKLMSGLSRLALMSTTRMTTVPATSCGILNSRHARTIAPPTTRGNGAEKRTSRSIVGNVSRVVQASRLFTPTSPIAASDVISSMRTPTANAAESKAEPIPQRVRNAGLGLPPVRRTQGAIVDLNAPTAFTTEIVSINTVPHAAGRVYNLEVADGYLPEFYANGILVHNSQEHMAAIARIPLVKLLGIQPAGLNASSEGELVAFEDWIAAFQNVLFRPALRTIIDFVQLSLWGEIDDDITFDFKPLRQMKPMEQAQLEAIKAQTREVYLQSGAVDANEVRETLAEDPDTPFDGVDLDRPLPPPPMGGLPGLGGGGGPPGIPGGGGGGMPSRPGIPGGSKDAVPSPYGGLVPEYDSELLAYYGDVASHPERYATDDVIAYHGTRTSALQSILDNGILSHPFKHYHPQHFYQGERGASVYVTEDPNIARQWALSEVDDPADITILQVDLPRAGLKLDEEAQGAERFVGDIPPQWIRAAFPVQPDGTFGPAIEMNRAPPTIDAPPPGGPPATRYLALAQTAPYPEGVWPGTPGYASDADPDWDESKVKRAKGGQFAKQAEKGGPGEKPAKGEKIMPNPHVAGAAIKAGYQKVKGEPKYVHPATGHTLEFNPPSPGAAKGTGSSHWKHTHGTTGEVVEGHAPTALKKHFEKVHGPNAGLPASGIAKPIAQPAQPASAPTPVGGGAKSSIPQPVAQPTAKPPKGWEHLPHVKNDSGATFYSNGATSAQTTEQLMVTSGGGWTLWKKGHGTVAQGANQAELEAAAPTAKGGGAKPTPPKGFEAVLPHTTEMADGVKVYSDGATTLETTEQIAVKPDGSWAIWQQGKGSVASGQGQESLNQAFEKLHPRDAHGHFVGKGTPTEPPAFAGGDLAPPTGWTPDYVGKTVKSYTGPDGSLLDIYKDGEWHLSSAQSGMVSTANQGTTQAELNKAVAALSSGAAPTGPAPPAPTTAPTAKPATVDGQHVPFGFHAAVTGHGLTFEKDADGTAVYSNADTKLIVVPPDDPAGTWSTQSDWELYHKGKKVATGTGLSKLDDELGKLSTTTPTPTTHGPAPYAGQIAPPAAWGKPYAQSQTAWSYQLGDDYLDIYPDGTFVIIPQKGDAVSGTTQAELDAATPGAATHGPKPYHNLNLAPPATGWAKDDESSGSYVTMYADPDGHILSIDHTGQWELWTDKYAPAPLAKGTTQSEMDAALAQHYPGSTNAPGAAPAVATPAPSVGQATPPSDIGEVLPHKKEFAGVGLTLYHDGATPGESTEQVTFNATGSWSIWQKDGPLLEGKGQESFNQAFESLHPRDENGHFIKKDTGETSGPAKSTKVEQYTDSSPLPAALNGVAFDHWTPPTDWATVEGTKPDLVEPPLPALKPGQHLSAGVLIQEPDGRVWLVKPKGEYGGYKYTFPKGGQESGLGLQQTAIKEGWEESGLKAEITGFAGDYEGETSITRYYLAKRTGGTPTGYQPSETEEVTLVPPGELKNFLNKKRDHDIADNHLGATGAATTPIPGVTASNALNLAQMKKVGKQLGSNPGGRYATADGTEYYVKQLQSDDHVNNEMLAAALYRAAGGKTFEYSKVLDNGKLALATKWQKLKTGSIDKFTPAQRQTARRDFAIQAWLGNRDAAGIDNTNIGVTQDGSVIPTDLGGSLLFRAQGLPKALDPGASEWETLRDPAINQQTHALYGAMTADELQQSANRLKAVTDATIDQLVAQYAPSDPQQAASLAQNLKLRRDAILKKATPAAATQTGLTKESAGEVKETLAQSAPPRSKKVQSAITDYKGSGYDEMNACARFLDECEDDRITAMDQHLAKTSLPAATLYRGIKPDNTYVKKVRNLLNKYGPGTGAKKPLQLPDEGFSSTSTWRQFSDNWRGDATGLLFEIEAPEGFKGDVVHPNVYDHEHEVLLPRGCRYEVTGWNSATGVIKCRLVQTKIKTGAP